MHNLMGYLQETVQKGDCLNEDSDLQRMFTSIKEQKVLIDVNREFALYCDERLSKKPLFGKLTKDHTKGGHD